MFIYFIYLFIPYNRNYADRMTHPPPTPCPTLCIPTGLTRDSGGGALRGVGAGAREEVGGIGCGNGGRGTWNANTTYTHNSASTYLGNSDFG
jgi:hypothetical protein